MIGAAFSRAARVAAQSCSTGSRRGVPGAAVGLVASFGATAGGGAALCSGESNPLLETACLFPRFGEVKAEHVDEAMEVRLRMAGDRLTALEERIESTLASGKTPSYADVANGAEQISELVSSPWGIVGHLKKVKDSEPLREAHKKSQPLVVEFNTKISQSAALFKAWRALRKDASAWALLSTAQQRVVELELQAAELSGIGLEGEKKDRFNEIAKELAKLSTSFSNNVLDATKSFSRRCTCKEEVEGLPPSALRMLAANARTRGDENATLEDGPWVVTLDIPCFMAVMKDAVDPVLREAVYRAYLTRASEHGAGVDNAPLINQTLELRREKAELLGFKSFAEVSLAKKMATLDGAVALMEDLRQKSFGPAEAEQKELEAFAGRELQLWDSTFFADKLKTERFSYDDETVRQYFSLDNVLTGLIGVIARLFNVEISQRVPSELGAQVWDEHVRMFEVRRDGKPCAYFYLDPFSRAAEKSGGAWMSGVCDRSKACAPVGMPVRLPVAHMVCNQSPPVANPDGSVTPSLMTFREVETLFHECGHALQHMLTEVDEGIVSGINGVEWDAVEQPSQFMEYWAYDVATLRGMAKHWQTGESIPDELIEKIRAAKTFRAASMMLRQIKFSLLDLALHDAAFVPGGKRTIWEVDHEVSARTQVRPSLPEDRFLCGFSHIFAGGYAAGYFSYKWAEVLSADGFAAFEEAGLENEVAVKDLGKRYSETVLGMGGSRPAAQVFEAFRGRGPAADALLRHSDLLKPTHSSL